MNQFSIFALGVTPYITASIIIQLLSMDVIPPLTELAKSGAKGRKQLDRYTRYLAVVLGFVQAAFLVWGFSNQYSTLTKAEPLCQRSCILQRSLQPEACSFYGWVTASQ